MQILLQAVQYNVHQWNICGDLKVAAMWMGVQGGCRKFCFLCRWDGRCTDRHYIKRDLGAQKD